MGSNMYAFNETKIGFSHIATHKPCQDASLSRYAKSYAIGIVADGHGGQSYFRSDVGAQKACEVAMSVLRELLHATSYLRILPSGDWQKQIASSIISRWQDAIAMHKDEHPITEDEWAILSDKDKNRYEHGKWQFIYGTTLIAIVRTKTAFLGLQIGDGKCVTIDSNNHCSQPIPWDDDCFLNRTTSLCDSDAINRFRFVFQTDNLPIVAFVGTDGLDDSLGTDEQLELFYRNSWKVMESDKKVYIRSLRDCLPRFSAEGSQDDISIAGVYYDDDKSVMAPKETERLKFGGDNPF